MIIKRFDELTTDELYDILKLRVDVFVVEQECPYPEIDGKDRDCVHVSCVDESDGLIAYARVFEKPEECGVAQIGRVIAAKRGVGLGRAVMESAIQACRDCLGAREAYLEGQVYARGFYEQLGFAACSEEFLEDGIPHVEMRMPL